MKKVFINYAHNRYLESQNKCSKSATPYFDEVHSFRYDDIDDNFKECYRNILEGDRGAGYWLWKPYFLKKMIRELDPGDILFYADSGSNFRNDPQPLFNTLEQQNILLFIMDHFQNKMWTKRDCFHLMGCDNDKYVNGPHWNAAFLGFKVSDEAISFIDEYLYHCCDANILTDKENICGKPNYPEFKDHRHDQSVLSLMALKHNIEPNIDPSQFGDLPYQVMYHHRSKK